jgi:hypothetical protein
VVRAQEGKEIALQGSLFGDRFEGKKPGGRFVVIDAVMV